MRYLADRGDHVTECLFPSGVEAEVEAIHLFDCSPRMAAKLARCNEIARAQLAKTQAGEVARWTVQDTTIIVARFGYRAKRLVSRDYARNLNA